MSHENIQPQRLMDAADAALQAVIEVAELLNGSYVPPTRLMGSEMQPQCLCEFTMVEVQEATAFLVRLGFLPT
jgi:hypothetical protein